MTDGALPFDPTRKPELDKPGPRKELSKFDFASKFLEQNGRCYLCNEKLVRGQIIDEHDPPRETMPAAICDDLRFRKLACKPCAKAKTVGDQGVIAKGRRLRREKGQQARRDERGSQIPSRPFSKAFSTLSMNPKGAACGLKSRGFDKTKSRKFSGQVVSRGSIRSKAGQS